jgi:hypothetical protein
MADEDGIGSAIGQHLERHLLTVQTSGPRAIS